MCNIFSILNGCLGAIFSPLTGRIMHALGLEGLVDDLEIALQELMAVEEHVMRRVGVAVQEAPGNNKEMLPQVELWIRRVGEALAVGDTLRETGEQLVERKFFLVMCSTSRYFELRNFSIGAELFLNKLNVLTRRGEDFAVVADEVPKYEGDEELVNRRLVDLETAVRELMMLKENLMLKARDERRGLRKNMLPQVEWWFSRVETEAVQGSELVIRGRRQLKRLGFRSYCSVYGGAVDKCFKHLDELKGRGKRFEVMGGLVGDHHQEEGTAGLLAELACDPSMNLQTNFSKVWGCVVNRELTSVGVYGYGSETTALLIQVRNRVVLTYGHDLLVIWVVVGRHATLDTIQEGIMNRFGVSDQEVEDVSVSDREVEDVTAKRKYIRNKLEENKFVLFLVDLCSPFSFKRIGIPPRPKLLGSTIIFTTHSREVCLQMCAQRIFKIVTFEDHVWGQPYKSRIKTSSN